MGSVEEEKKNVIEWLKHPHELGKEPQAVEYVKTIQDAEGMECMIFKYRKGRLSPWLLAISSEAGIFSHMEKYDPATAEKDADDFEDKDGEDNLTVEELKEYPADKAGVARAPEHFRYLAV